MPSGANSALLCRVRAAKTRLKATCCESQIAGR